MGFMKKRVNQFPTPYTCMNAVKKGGVETKLSMVVLGLGNMMHKQVIKGLIFLAVEIAYLAYMITTGFHWLAMLPSLGSVEQEEVWDEALQVYVYTQGDRSILFLLYGVATVLLTLLMVWIWRGCLKSAWIRRENMSKTLKRI